MQSEQNTQLTEAEQRERRLLSMTDTGKLTDLAAKTELIALLRSRGIPAKSGDDMQISGFDKIIAEINSTFECREPVRRIDGELCLPANFHKENSGWKVTMDLSSWLKLYQRWRSLETWISFYRQERSEPYGKSELQSFFG